jgi:hypothetical protein
MSHLRRTLLMLSVSCFLGGCTNGFSYKDLFFVELEEKRMCKQLDDEVIPPAPPGALEVSKAMPFSPPSELQGEAVDQLRLQFTDITVEANDNTRLDGIEEVMVAMRPKGATDLAQAKTILAYKRQAGSSGQPLRLQGEEMDLSALTSDGPMELFLQLKGALPNEEWTVRIQACWAFRVRVNYLYLVPSL